MKTETYKVKITYHENGNKRSEIWHLNNQLHRIDGPAIQFQYEKGNKDCEFWYQNNNLNRLNGPAIQSWYKNGQKYIERWFENGKEIKPNTINIDGKEVSEETIINALRNYFK